MTLVCLKEAVQRLCIRARSKVPTDVFSSAACPDHRMHTIALSNFKHPGLETVWAHHVSKRVHANKLLTCRSGQCRIMRSSSSPCASAMSIRGKPFVTSDICFTGLQTSRGSSVACTALPSLGDHLKGDFVSLT